MRHSIAPTTPALLAGLLFLSSGCAYGELKQVLRTQIAAETGCDAVKVSKRQEYAGAPDGEYEAKACGEIRLYRCPVEGGLYDYDEQVCELESTRKAGPPGLPTPDDGMDGEMEEAQEEFSPPADDDLEEAEMEEEEIEEADEEAALDDDEGTADEGEDGDEDEE